MGDDDEFSDGYATDPVQRLKVEAVRRAERARARKEEGWLAGNPDALALRIRFRDLEEGQRPTARDIVQDIQAGQQILIYTHFLGTLTPSVFEAADPYLASTIALTNLSQSTQRGLDAPVLQMTLNSPLEIMLWITGVSGTLTLSANRLIDTFNRLQDARRNKSDADLHVAQSGMLQEQIARVREATYPVAQPQIERLVADTSYAMSRVESIELFGGHGQAVEREG